MNIFFTLIFISTIIWSFFCDKYFLLIFLTILLLQNFVRILLTNPRKLKSYASIFKRPLNPTIYSGFELKLKKIDKYLKNHNLKNPDNKLTYTHIAIKALSEAIKKYPEILNYLSFTNLKIIKNIDIAVIIETNKKELLTKIIKDTEKKKISKYSSILKKEIKSLKKGKSQDLKNLKKLAKKFKSYTLSLIFKISTFFIYNFIYNSQNQKIRNKIAFCAVSNCTHLFTDEGYACHITLGRAAFCLVINTPRNKVVFENGKIGSQKIVFLSVIGDCRKIGVLRFFGMVQRIKEVWNDFEKFV